MTGGPPIEKRILEFKKLIAKIPSKYRGALHLIPVVAGGKAPDVPKGVSTKTVRLSIEEAVRRLREGKNVGIMFHADSTPFFAVDVDVGDDALTQDMADELLDLFPRTFTVRTPSGGYHLYFSSVLLPKVSNAKYKYKGRDAGEIRARDYYVLTPGSVVGGRMYTVVEDAPFHAIIKNEFPPIELRAFNSPQNHVVVGVCTLPDVEGFDPKKYTVPGTAWTLSDVFRHDPLIPTLLSVSVDAQVPIKILDKVYPSQSEIDAAVLSRLSYYGVPAEDAFVILKKYRYRKKLDREDYLPRTWEKVAVDNFAKAQRVHDPSLPLMTYFTDEDLKKILKGSEERDFPVFEDVLSVISKDHFISRYVSVMRTITDAYPEYHIAVALFLLSVVAGPNLVYSYPRMEDPRLYLLIVGRPAISHKSTAVKLGLSLFEGTPIEDLRGANDFSTEGFLNALASKNKQFFYYDEMSKLFKAFQKTYSSDVEEIFLQFFNRIRFYRRQLARRVYNIENPWIAWIGCTTFSNFEATFSEERVRSGFFSRVLYVAPKYSKEEKPTPHISPEAAREMKELSEWLETIYTRLNNIASIRGSPLPVVLAQDCNTLPHSWLVRKREQISAASYPDDIKEHLYDMLSRYQEYLIRIAILVRLGRAETLQDLAQVEAAARGEGLDAFVEREELFVSKRDVDVAIQIMNKIFYRYADEMLKLALTNAKDSIVDRVYNILRSRGGSEKYSVLLRSSKLDKDTFSKVVDTLVERGDAIIINKPTKGRPAKYVVLKEVFEEGLRDVEDNTNEGESPEGVG